MEKLYSVNWHELFVPHGSLVELILRGTFMYLGLFLLMRFILRRNPGNLNIADILLVVILADAAQNALAGEYKSITEGLILVGTIIGWNYALDWLAFRIPLVQKLMEPPPLLLVKNGRMVRANMRLEMITEDELRSQLRQHGISNLLEVKEAHMESDGHVSVIRKHDHAA